VNHGVQTALLARVVDAADALGWPLYAGWRTVELSPDPPARVAQLLHDDVRARRARAQELTDELVGPAYEVLSGGEAQELLELLDVLNRTQG